MDFIKTILHLSFSLNILANSLFNQLPRAQRPFDSFQNPIIYMIILCNLIFFLVVTK
jgi:hypothetical protein